MLNSCVAYSLDLNLIFLSKREHGSSGRAGYQAKHEQAENYNNVPDAETNLLQMESRRSKI